MKPGAPSLQSTRLLDQVREPVRYMHYSFNIIKCYLFGVNYFIFVSPRGSFNAPTGRVGIWQIAENAGQVTLSARLHTAPYLHAQHPQYLCLFVHAAARCGGAARNVA
jgi:hypothetical protein